MAHKKNCSFGNKAWTGWPSKLKGKVGWVCDACDGFIECETTEEIAARQAQISHEESIKTGNPKDAIGITKTPLHLASSIATIYASIAHFLGNVKYGAWNWRGAGIRYSVYYAALMRHMFRWWNGEDNDPVDGTPHLANALCCLNIIIEGMYMKNAVDDRPPAVNLDAAMKMAEDLMPLIKAKYADKNPKHWTIADAGHTPMPRKKQKRRTV